MTREVKIGNIGVGGNNPVRIQGMLKNSTKDIKGIIREARKLEKEGAEVIRVAVKENSDAKLAPLLHKRIATPLIADIHFNYRLALAAIESGFDGIRLNPLNIHRENQVREVVRKVKQAGIPIRVGINSGGFRKGFSSPQALAKQMVRAVGKYLRIFERNDFFDTMVSLKASDIHTTVLANREFAKHFRYPLHIGVTATGPFIEATIKSSMGIGILLSEGIGQIIRVSLTAPSFWEVRVAKSILQFLGLRRFFCEVISCPTCSRCEVDLIKIVNRFRTQLDARSKDAAERIALMGCVVNGPGEAYQADIGVAFGKKKAAIFRKDKILRYTDQKRVVSDVMQLLKKQ